MTTVRISSVTTMRTCDAAVLVLRETDNPAVMWGDEGLCHLIANRAGLKTVGRAWLTSDRVLANLSRLPGDLVPGTTTIGSGRRVRCFWLPEHAPEYLRPRLKCVTDPNLDAPDGAVVDGYRRSGDTWVRI